jgi:putative thioredoxin
MSESPYVFEATRETFPALVIEASDRVPVLVDFWAAWCAPCRILMPILASLASSYGGKLHVVKVNTDVEQALALEYGVRSLPTVKLFRNGRVVDEFLGALPESAVREFLGRYLERDSDRVRARALDAHAQGRSAEAEALLRQALAEDPDNLRIPIDLAVVLSDQGRFAEGEQVLKGLPANKQLEPEVVELLKRLGFASVASTAPDPATLEQRLAAHPGDSEARYQLACHRVLQGDYERALELLFELLRRDRDYRDDAARKAMLAVFDLLGGRGPLVSRYRGLMAGALY